MSETYAPRPLRDKYLIPVEEELVGETLFKAAEYLAETQDEDYFCEIYEPGHPLKRTVERGVGDVSYAYSFMVYRDDDTEAPGNFLAFNLESEEVEAHEFKDMEPGQRETLLDLLAMSDVPYDELIGKLQQTLEDEDADSVVCTKKITTTYACDQETNTIRKYSEVDYLIGSESVMVIGPDPSDPTDTSDAAMEMRGMAFCLSVAEVADIKAIEEILYYLDLPGGKLTKDVTTHYVDENYTLVGEQ